METMQLKLLGIKLKSLAVFRSLLTDPVIEALLKYIDNTVNENTEESIKAYGDFVSKLYHSRHESLGGYIKSIVSNDENCYINLIGRGKTPSDMLIKAMEIIKAYGGNCGIWFSNGIYYIDKSHRVNTKKLALQIGRECNQISILKWANMSLAYC